MTDNKIITKIIWFLITIIFLIFLALPLLKLFSLSLDTVSGIGMGNYLAVFNSSNFYTMLKNSFLISTLSAITAQPF